MHGIVDCKAARDDLLGPALRIIVDPHKPGTRCAEARMVEQREIMKAELGGDAAQKRPKLGEVSAAPRGFREAIPEPPQVASSPKDRFTSWRKAPASLLAERRSIFE